MMFAERGVPIGLRTICSKVDLVVSAKPT